MHISRFIHSQHEDSEKVNKKLRKKQDTITAVRSFPLKDVVTDLAGGSSKQHREDHALATNSFSNSVVIL